jgi:hypothetical protein
LLHTLLKYNFNERDEVLPYLAYPLNLTAVHEHERFTFTDTISPYQEIHCEKQLKSGEYIAQRIIVPK